MTGQFRGAMMAVHGQPLDTQTNSGALPTSTYTYAAGWEIPPYNSSQQGGLPSSTTLQIDGSGVLDLGGCSQTIGSLSGYGLISNGTLSVTGPITPGGTNTIGTLSLFDTALSGTLRVDVNADGFSDLLAVQGDINLSSLSFEIEDSDQLLPSMEYTVLTCTGIRSNEFASITLPEGWYVNYLPDGTVKLVYNGGILILIR